MFSIHVLCLQKMSSGARLVTMGFLLSLAASATAIRCWKCGQYSDGVGSITPCNNRSAAHLEECPGNSKYCIKYVSELTIVRDCVPTCKEKGMYYNVDIMKIENE
ncbi:unnamed protein product [Diatraea saccharalis]|uniref:Uncharacterized protein n=1 Tax=Diatraea saccharalis TaxID=40085 RepID=A0A9P0CC75_9NEOP|nr:unnamed protein product [Diatraea saccharalis]